MALSLATDDSTPIVAPSRSTALGLAVVAMASMLMVLAVGVLPSSAQGDCGGLRQQAERGLLSGRFVTGTEAFRTYVAVPDRAGPPQPDDYVEFCVTIPETGTYSVEGATFATSGSVDSFYVSFDAGPRALWDIRLSTGWVVDPVSARGVADPVVWQLTSGEHKLRVSAREDGTLLDRIQVSAHPGPATDLALLQPPPVADPSVGVTALPGVIEAEAYSDAYDTDLGNEGTATDYVGDVDVYKSRETGAAISDASVGRIRTGEWTEYNVSVAEADDYTFTIRAASNGGDGGAPGEVTITVDGADSVSGTIPLTGDWWKFRSTEVGSLGLSAGDHTIRVAWTTGYVTFDSLSVAVKVDEAPPLPTPTSQVGVVPTSTPQVPTATPIPTVQTKSQWPKRVHTIPGKIEAEDYDRGGAEVAYHDADPGNLGGWIRTNGADEGVDMTDAEDPSGYMIAWIEDGDWTEYTFTLDAPMTVDLGARVASGAAAAGDLEVIIDGEHLGTIDVRDSGGWLNWETLFLRSLDLGAGEHTMRLTAINGGDFNLNWVRFDRPSGRIPFYDVTVPGRIEAENFDIGGQGLTYFDKDTRNYGVPYRWDAVDVYPSADVDGSYYVGRAHFGDWTEYSFDASNAGETYDLDLRVAPRSTSWGTVRVFVDGNVVDTVYVPPTTGGQQNWRTLSIDRVTIPDGEHILRLAPHNVNINYVDIAATGTTLPTVLAITETQISVDPSENLGLIANRAPSGATFYLKPGVHLGDHVNPKNGQKFFGIDGAILDGGNRGLSAFDGGGNNVQIRNLEIRNYSPGNFRGAISARNNSNYGENGTAWIVADNTIHSNNAAGINVGTGMWVLRNTIHSNVQIGVSGLGRDPSSMRLSGLLIKDNEIFNNSSPNPSFAYTIHEGGLKITFADSPRVLSNHVHDNFGIGLYCDLYCDNPTFDGNVVTNNIGRRSGGGIFVEISTNGTISNNVISNPAATLSAERVFGIRIGESSNVSVHDNEVTMDGGAALEVRYWNSRPMSSEVVFEKNRIVAANGRTEIRTWPGQATFVGNTYVTNPDSSVRFHHDGVRTWSEWLALGFDSPTSLVNG